MQHSKSIHVSQALVACVSDDQSTNNQSMNQSINRLINHVNLLQALVACVREDLADLATMSEGLQEGSTKGEGA